MADCINFDDNDADLNSKLFWNANYLIVESSPPAIINLKENRLEEKWNTYLNDTISSLDFEYLFITESDKSCFYILTESYTKIK
jgi:hypothetical protein